MTLGVCPQCGNETLRTTNVMASTQMIHRACGNCCYSDKQHYEGDNLVGEPIPDKKLKWKREAVDVTPTNKEPKYIVKPGQMRLEVE